MRGGIRWAGRAVVLTSTVGFWLMLALWFFGLWNPTGAVRLEWWDAPPAPGWTTAPRPKGWVQPSPAPLIRLE